MLHDLSRRNVLRLIGAGSVGALLAGRSRAFAQPAPTSADPSLQGAGFFTFPLGEAKVSLVSDGGFVMKPGDIFPKLPKSELEDATKAAHISNDGYPGQINVVLIRRGNDVILIDAGSGRAFGPTAGYLVRNLARAGVQPADVTHVVLSHAHPDHAGGLLTAEGAPQFPRAKVFVNRAEHEFWTGPAPAMPGSLLPPDFQKMMITAATTALAGVKDSLELVKPDDTVAGIVKLIDAAGHTPGHVVLRVGAADGPHLTFLGDAIVFLPLQLKRPDWHPIYDADPVMAALTRRKLLESLAKDESLTSAAHATFPSVGYIDREGDSFRWTPRPWTWE